MSINYYGVLNLTDAFYSLLRPNARVVNVASKLGLLSRLPGQSHKKRILNAKTIQDVSQVVEDYVKLDYVLLFIYYF
jgi:NAD(P)-dependent dehydrogenase (short-subunit alcohol dehydrogenase family)